MVRRGSTECVTKSQPNEHRPKIFLCMVPDEESWSRNAQSYGPRKWVPLIETLGPRWKRLPRRLLSSSTGPSLDRRSTDSDPRLSPWWRWSIRRRRQPAVLQPLCSSLLSPLAASGHWESQRGWAGSSPDKEGDRTRPNWWRRRFDVFSMPSAEQQPRWGGDFQRSRSRSPLTIYMHIQQLFSFYWIWSIGYSKRWIFLKLNRFWY